MQLHPKPSPVDDADSQQQNSDIYFVYGVSGDIEIRVVFFCMNKGCTDFPKSRNHVNILGASRVIGSKYPTKDTGISTPPYKH
jgi:hypothetical protein